MEFRRIQPWARDALVEALHAQPVIRGVARCIAEENVLLLQLLHRPKISRVTVIQWPVASVAAAYEKLVQPDMIPILDHNDYFIVASAPALQQAEIDSVPFMRTIPTTGSHPAEVLRVPVLEVQDA